jgi:hypothetical protein
MSGFFAHPWKRSYCILKAHQLSGFFAHLCGGNIDAVLIVVRGDCFVPLSKKAKIFFFQISVIRKQRV